MTSPLTRTGHARFDTATTPGDAIQRATQRKRGVTYPELADNRRCRLVVVALETGGRWGQEAADLLRALARAKARGSPPILRQTATSSYIRRWSAVIALAAQRALAASYLEHNRGDYDHVDGPPPAFHDLLSDNRHAEPPYPSRLPPTRSG